MWVKLRIIILSSITFQESLVKYYGTTVFPIKGNEMYVVYKAHTLVMRRGKILVISRWSKLLKTMVNYY